MPPTRRDFAAIAHDDEARGGSSPICVPVAHVRPRDALRAKTDFVCAFNAIPRVHWFAEKYSALSSPQISFILSHIPPPEKGRIAIVTNVEAGSGGRETSQRVLRADERCFADGQAVWSWHPDAGVPRNAFTHCRGRDDASSVVTGRGQESRSPGRARRTR